MKKTSHIFMYSLGGLIAIGFFVILFALITKAVPESNSEALYIVLGALVASFSGVVSYFFGSSQGSRDKTEMYEKGKKE
jgi:amino acid permease